jgi:hypothetical protein
MQPHSRPDSHVLPKRANGMNMSPESLDNHRFNGLEVLKKRGVPDAAITSLLIALAVSSVLPCLGGRDFGPYSMPMLVRPQTFWVLTLLTPVLWVALLVKVFPVTKPELVRAAKTLLLVETGFIALGAVTAPITRIDDFPAHVSASSASEVYPVDIPFAQTIEASVGGLSSPYQVHIYVCGATDKDADCIQAQRGDDSNVTHWVSAGRARVWVFNYEQNHSPLDLEIRVRHVSRLAI